MRKPPPQITPVTERPPEEVFAAARALARMIAAQLARGTLKLEPDVTSEEKANAA